MNFTDLAYYAKDPLPPPDLTECFASVAGQDLIADVFKPIAGRDNGAAVLLLHGGGWTGGHRHGFLWHAHRLAQRGYLTCTIDYRLAPAHRYPAAVEDCQAALDWLIEHKNAALCEIFTGGTLDEKRDLWEQASPVRYVNSDSAPMFITHDPADASVPYDQSTMLVEALCRAGRPVQFIPTPGSGHGFFYNPASPWVARIWPAVVEWLDRFLWGNFQNDPSARTLISGPQTQADNIHQPQGNLC